MADLTRRSILLSVAAGGLIVTAATAWIIWVSAATAAETQLLSGGAFLFYLSGLIWFLYRMLDRDVKPSIQRMTDDLLLRAKDKQQERLADVTDPALTALSGAIAALLRSTEKRMAEFAETGADWFWEMDDKFRFTYVSNNTGEIVGGDAAKILGQTEDVLLHGESDPDEWARHLAMMKARLPFKDFVYRRRSNTKVR